MARVVLVVDDDPMVRFVTAEYIRDCGYPAVEVADAAEAISVLESNAEIRIVVTDINMPGDMNGLQLARYVRDTWPPVHLIITSGLPDASRNLPSAAVYLHKPFSLLEMAAILSRFAADGAGESQTVG